MKNLILLLIFIFLLVLFIPGIGPGIVSGENSDSVGSNTPKESKVLLEEIMSIGALKGDSHYIFHNPYEVDVDSEGNIYVLDAGNFRIQKFDKNGKYLLSIGRKGQGPGEFFDCFDFDLDRQGNVIL